MNLIKCESGHIYDADKFGNCPHCANIKSEAGDLDIFGKNQKDINTVIPEKKSFGFDIRGRRKTVGFLACIWGEMQGDAFILREGVNDIGRASNMDVALIKEPTVSRSRHACITYDGDKNEFLLNTYEHREDVFLNDEPVFESVVLNDRDEIRIGACSLKFIALCNSEFVW